MSKQYHDREYLKSKIEEGLSAKEIGEIHGLMESSIRTFFTKNDLTDLYREYHPVQHDCSSQEKYDIPEDELRRVFVREACTYKECAEYFDCTTHAIRRRLERYGLSQKLRPVPYHISHNDVETAGDNGGYARWNGHEAEFSVHRLLAISEYGIKAVKDKEVHHKSLRWDNRPETIELLTKQEHRDLHRNNKHSVTDEREIHEVPRPPDPDQKEIDDFEPQDPLAF